jgi:hypothetical protein
MTARVLGVALVLATVALAAQSQPSTPGAGKRESAQTQPASAHQQPTADTRGSEASPVIVRVLPAPKSQEDTSNEAADRAQQSSAKRWTIGLTVLLALIGFGQLCVYGLQARRLRETIVKMDEIARSQTSDIRESIREATRAATAMERMAEAASENAVAAKASAAITDAMLATNREIERAYVTMSHHPPGINVHSECVLADGNPERWKHKIALKIKVQNHGNTPAQVTRTLVQVILTNAAEFPMTPGYAEELARPGYVSLVKGDSYTITTPYEFESTGEKTFSGAFRELAEHGHRLYVIGYTDYIDKFGQRHRCGYGRVYNPAADDRNLPEYLAPGPPPDADTSRLPAVFRKHAAHFDDAIYNARSNLIFLTQPGYNYDRTRTRGEGNDWDDPSQ